MNFNNRNRANKFAGGAHGLARVISKRGFCSRSKAEMLVREGRVTLNGRIEKDIDFPTREQDEIIINGKRIEANQKIYFMMNKPRGIVTTASDEKGRKTVMELFAERYRQMFSGKEPPHISPVGRLDAASEGLLLFTNDTEWANKILEPRESFCKTKDEIYEPRNFSFDAELSTKWRRKTRDCQTNSADADSPSYAENVCIRHSEYPLGAKNPEREVPHFKIYHVQTKGKPSADDLQKMEAGFMVPPRIFGESEEFMKAASAKIHNEGEKNCWLEITLTEGKNRQIRRMLAHLGYDVLRLVRIQIDNFILGDLKPGEIREIK